MGLIVTIVVIKSFCPIPEMRSEVLYLAPKLRKKATDLIHLTEFFEWKEPQ